MKVTFRTVGQESFELEVDGEEDVEEVLTRVEDRLGRENLYRLIHQGKVLQEGELVREHGITGRLPVVVLVTRPRQELEPGMGGKGKRVRTESEDSGFGEEEDEEEDGEHYITDREFTIALEVVESCQHFRLARQEIDREGMMAMVEQELEEQGVRQVILSRLGQVEEAGLSREQFRAFILDIESMWQEAREELPLEVEEREDDEEEEEEQGLVGRNLRSLTTMGFSQEEAAGALSRSFGSLQVAMDLLLPRDTTPPALPDAHCPLAFLREVPEFQYLRLMVLQQPALLQPLLLSFGQSHPEVMRQINLHKEQFVALLYEQTGGATGRYARHH